MARPPSTRSTTVPSPVPLTDPVPAPDPPAHPGDTPIFAEPTIRGITLADVDRVWDWIRIDPRAAEVFTITRSSLDLHRTFELLFLYQEQGMALIKAIDVDHVHVGVALVFPILPVDRIAVVHLYLHPERRGRGARYLVRRLIQLASADVPGLTLTAIVERPGLARWLQSIGFTAQYVMTRPPDPIVPEIVADTTSTNPPAPTDSGSGIAAASTSEESNHGRRRRQRVAPRSHQRSRGDRRRRPRARQS
jgi:GNAT superfamily N-acetyltransferase